ncbi:Lrp/AsnC family transcriptional regulator [Rhodococcus sp. D2-41]|uniref:Lrp/AsnC ligand binding domain-containing protein n=1 Tax=Speluncibacter jeojiensis TaxID=2710754 RepID=A0A9X4RC34_9ACTN|nr:Lrp/AsnC ligand binding domain-containing protein [Rhodococcus sp. D2-41]MDG3011948.1 Lrp/AsnC family transcriptional regulator [Rhodococcus sp. D2-41]MDG3013400.1 Lrp/AsnC ligand binding domain-containing protein [Corynebacteriales bacterium D3-21]
MITAIVLIHTEANRIPETAQAVADLSGVDSVYSCAGDVDLIAIVRVRDHAQIAEVVTEKINKTEGVVRTATHIAFKSYSNADVEAGFSIGE